MQNLVTRFLHSPSTRGQAARFLVVGGSSMLVDMAVYRAGLWFTGIVPAGKAAGFIVGTTFAFFANRAFTFKHDGDGQRQLLSFLSVYAVTLVVNVGLNSALLHLLGLGEFGLNVSFIIATVCSAALNFVGMKKFVFRPTT